MRRSTRLFALSLLGSAIALAGCAADEAATPPPAPETPSDEGRLLTSDGKADGVGDVPALAPLAEDADLERPLQVLFAPDDPVTTTELRLIEEVVTRRAADPEVYAEGENPFRIRYAVYNLRNPLIVDAANEVDYTRPRWDGGRDNRSVIETLGIASYGDVDQVPRLIGAFVGSKHSGKRRNDGEG